MIVGNLTKRKKSKHIIICILFLHNSCIVHVLFITLETLSFSFPITTAGAKNHPEWGVKTIIIIHIG